MDIKDKIISELEVIRNAESLAGNRFKVRAYNKVLDQLREVPAIRSMDDITAANVTGIGESIRKKLQEIIDTGKLEISEATKATIEAYNEIITVHGIGHVKALELIRDGIRTIADLRKNSDVLNAVQKLGLRFHDDIQKRIPRKEMLKHEVLLLKEFSDAGFTGSIAGSFRRGLTSSGDIDLLITPTAAAAAGAADEAVKRFHEVVNGKSMKKYIHAILALGDKKCMAVVKLPRHKTYRRLDILLTSPGEYPYALLYFTGSQNFNIGFRTEALKQGYTINEHGMVPVAGEPAKPKPKRKTKTATRQVPEMQAEEDIFRFLGINYVKPQDRLENIFRS
jgi:DNA polymerase beta